jgi:beta-lactamase class C
MHHLARLALPVCLISCSLPVYAVDEAELAAIVDTAFAPLMETYNVPGLSVGVTLGGEHYFFNYGVASLESGEPVTEHTLFELGSISKTFTGLLGGYAMVQGALALNDVPSRHIPEFAGTPIDQATLKHLGTYTAGGLPLQFPGGVATDDEALAYLASWKPDAAPGEVRRYSNPSIGFFGHLTARALGGDFVELLQDRIIRRLGLMETFVHVPESHIDSYAWGYSASNQAIRVNPGPFDDEAYGVKSSALDMIAFLDANLDPERFMPDLERAIEATHVPHFKVGPMAQGLGWEQMPYPSSAEELLAGNSRTMVMEANPALELTPDQETQGDVLYYKAGSTNGFGAYVLFVPKEEVGVVMLANKNVFMPARINAMYSTIEALALMK